MSNTLADYFVGLKLKPDVGSIKKVDQFFRVLENRINKASKKVSSKMDSFGIPTAASAAGQVRAIKQVSDANTRANNKALTEQRKINALERVRLATESLRQKSIRLQRSDQRLNKPVSSTSNFARSAKTAVGTTQTLAGTAVAGFGLGQLNDVSQRLEMLPVAMEAVTGSAAKAAQQLEFLAKLGHEMGATRLELAPEYTKMLASGMGTKLEGQMPAIFTSMVRYGKVMGLEPEEMKGSFKAVSQMINKQQIMAEELKGQLAERLPAAVRIMADAVTGGDTKKLFALMKKGNLDPNSALPKFAMELEKRAAGGMEAYKKTQRGQQNFARVALEDQLINFSKEGGSSAFFRIWKSFADTLPKLNGLVKALAGAFQGVARAVEGLGTILQAVSKLFDFWYTLPETVQDFGKIATAAFLAIRIQAGLLGATMARAFLPLTTAYIILEDFAYAAMGKDSVTKRAMDYFKTAPMNADLWNTGLNSLTPAGLATSFLDGYINNSKAGNIWSKITTDGASATASADAANKIMGAGTDAFKQKIIDINIDVTGDTSDSKSLAERISSELNATLKPLIFNKVPVE